MSVTSCTILVTPQADRFIALTRSVSRLLQLNGVKTINVRFGSRNVTVPVRLLNRKGNIVALSSSLASAIRLPGPGTNLIKSNGNRELQIGPLIGILTNDSVSRSASGGPRNDFVREFIQAGKNQAYAVAFTPSNVNWQEEVVTGYVQTPGGRWVRRTVPLPDVVYNRLPSRSAEKSASIREFKDRFVRRRIPLFNWSFFDKWEVYRLLDEDVEAARHVPDSQIDPSPEDIRQMVEKHKFVYLKPTAGSLGIGIYRLTHNPSRGYFARFRRNGTNVLIRFPRFEGLMGMLRRHNLRLQNYVVQQGIRLIELDNCPIDFRFHLTKNGQNRWVVAAIGAKKAGKGSVTTHVRSGGQLMTPEQVLGRTYGSRADSVLQNAKDTAIKLANAIEENYPHMLGELGFDIGIDQNERVWMFEANAKPGRSIFKHPSLKEQGKASIANLVEHCLYLSRFNGRREG